MRLTRSQLRAELRTLTAQHQADVAVIAKTLTAVQNLTAVNEQLRAEVARLRAEPTLADRIRVAHDLEVLEARCAEAEADRDLALAKLKSLADRYPRIFPADRAAS